MHKPIYRFDIIQNTDEWIEIKLGMFSASISDALLMAKDTKGYTSLISRIVEERITGSRCENNLFKGNWATDRGHEFEPMARENYEFRHLQVVKLVGVVIMDNWTLCSPDGLINEDGLNQYKCPIFSTQKEYLTKFKEKKPVISGTYFKQLQFELMVTNRDYNVFTSFHPKLRPLDIVVKRDLSMIQLIHDRLGEAKIEVNKEIERIKNL